jgi:LmbE family N-acetylglucosaminyl deacetylase
MMPGGQDLPMLNAEEIIATREAELRRSADEAGAREYAIESLSVPRAVIPAMANQIAPSAQATSQAAQQFLQSYLQRPNIDPSLAEVARGM